MVQKNLVLLQNQRKPSQLEKLINLISGKMIHKGKNNSIKLRKYYFCTTTNYSIKLWNYYFCNKAVSIFLVSRMHRFEGKTCALIKQEKQKLCQHNQ